MIELNFNLALKNIVKQELKGSNPVPDILGFLHIKSIYINDFNKILNKMLQKNIENINELKILSLLKIDVPKPNFTIRPMARPNIINWLFYEAVINYFAEIILKNKEICKPSYSILNFSKEKGIEKENHWIEFDNNSREFYYNKGYKWAVVTDITGYYENISLNELRKRIIDFTGNDGNLKLIKFLFKMLINWSCERIENYGIPQGPSASGFLGDIFLDSVDRVMEKYDGYFRYMDDIRIFCKEEIQAKSALKDIVLALRTLKLNINAKKTDILYDKQIESELFDPKKVSLDSIQSAMETKEEEIVKLIAIPGLLQLVNEAFYNDKFEKRHIVFSLYRLGILYNSGFNFDYSIIIKNIKDNFISKPHHTGIFCDFLSNFKNDNNIPKFLISFIKSKNNIYEWQEIKILQTLLRFNFIAIKSDIDFFLRKAKDANNNFAIRVFYFLLIGKYGDNRDRNLLIDIYNGEHPLNNYTKMAILISVQELGKASRNDFYSKVRNIEEKEIILFIQYIKSLRNPIYYLALDKKIIETYKTLEPEYF